MILERCIGNGRRGAGNDKGEQSQLELTTFQKTYPLTILPIGIDNQIHSPIPPTPSSDDNGHTESFDERSRKGRNIFSIKAMQKMLWSVDKMRTLMIPLPLQTLQTTCGQQN